MQYLLYTLLDSDAAGFYCIYFLISQTEDSNYFSGLLSMQQDAFLYFGSLSDRFPRRLAASTLHLVERFALMQPSSLCIYLYISLWAISG